jgi:hypothetical protein
MAYIILAIAVIAFMFLSGCKPKPKPPEPDPEPDPDKPKWSDYYPIGWYKPLVDLYNKWVHSDYESIEWQNYVSLINGWNETLYNNNIPKGEISDRKLWLILRQKKSNGEYLFKWTSDMDIWGKTDHWAAPEQFLILKDKDGNPDPDGKYRDDCDTFCRLHNQYLFETCNYWLSLFVEVYWKKKYWNKVSDSYQWKSLGHAITLYKITPDDDWKCFSNQQWLSASHGEKRIIDYVYKFVPINKPEFVDQYELIRIKARHPISGELLWEVKGDDLA